MSDVLAAGSLDQLVRPHPAGTVLFREGDKGDKMYVIRSGKVKIVKHIADSDITLAVLGTGEFFGEMALLEGLPRSAEATVAEDALLIEVEGPAFDTLVRKNGEIAVRLMRRLSERMREADRQIQLALRLDPESWEVNKEAARLLMLAQQRLHLAAQLLVGAAGLLEQRLPLRGAGLVHGGEEDVLDSFQVGWHGRLRVKILLS